jgi:choline dehydrogenase-like flavoprotein
LDVFTHGYRDLFSQESNVKVYLNSSACEIVSEGDSQAISMVKCLTPRGHFWVKAKYFVLATGGIENARILLMSNKYHPNGLGNQNDLVGRFFMDHQLVRVGVIHASNQYILNRMKLYSVRDVDGSEIQAKPVLSRQIMEREKLLNANFFLISRPFMTRYNLLRNLFPGGKSYVSKAVSSAITLSRKLRRADLQIKDLEHLSNVLRGLDDIIYFQARKLTSVGASLDAYWPEDRKRQQSLGAVQVYSSVEQAPRLENRVVLDQEKDRFGYPKTQVFWHWDDLSRNSFVRASRFFGKEVARAGMGKLVLELDKGDPQLVSPSIHHHMGTTRMHDDPRQGVVDANCKVHGMANLFIAGSSTFTTGGYANPTLTIVALAIRLADHLNAKVR